jgi:hypothetical protein
MKKVVALALLVGGAVFAALPFFSCKHRDASLRVEDGTMFLWCPKCGRRSPGWTPGPPRYRRTQ